VSNAVDELQTAADRVDAFIEVDEGC